MEVRSIKLVVETLNQASIHEVYPGVAAPFVSLKTLLAMKQAAGRDVDLIDIDRLRKLHPDV